MMGSRWSSFTAAMRCLASLVAAVALAAGAPAQTPPDPAPPAPVTLTILPSGTGPFQVTVVFPAVVDRAVATAALDALVHRSGWQAAGLEWTETPAEGAFPAQTSAQFMVDSLYPNGEFPVEAIAVAFRGWRTIHVMFAHGGMFQYTGQPRYEDGNATVEITAQPNALTLTYDIRNPNLESLPGVPSLSPGGAAAAPQRRPGIPLVGWWLIAALGAIVAWVLVYALLHNATRARR